jgi:D-alanyl-lipoteichoic acid acyltransferase DltB (MBOAT superfamily)
VFVLCVTFVLLLVVWWWGPWLFVLLGVYSDCLASDSKSCLIRFVCFECLSQGGIETHDATWFGLI